MDTPQPLKVDILPLLRQGLQLTFTQSDGTQYIMGYDDGPAMKMFGPYYIIKDDLGIKTQEQFKTGVQVLEAFDRNRGLS